MVSEHIIFLYGPNLRLITLLYVNYNFTPPKVLTWTSSPKGGKDWVLVSCHQKTFIVYHNLMCSQSICSPHTSVSGFFPEIFSWGAIIMQISNVTKIVTKFSIQAFFLRGGGATEEINMGNNASTNQMFAFYANFIWYTVNLMNHSDSLSNIYPNLLKINMKLCKLRP